MTARACLDPSKNIRWFEIAVLGETVLAEVDFILISKAD